MFLVAQTLLPSTVNWRDRGAIAANHLDVTMRRIVLTGGSAAALWSCAAAVAGALSSFVAAM
jgi:hypothetical protein